MVSWEDPWEVLGVDEDATQREVESAFRKKALSCHPDRHPDDPTARGKFDRLSRAKETLLDPAKREAAEYRRKHGCDPPTPGGQELQQRKGPAPGEWMEGRGFRARAPDERKRAENERIQKADEEAFKRYQAQRRAQAQEYLRESSGGQLGGGGANLQEARQAFAQRLEQESDPKARRRQRQEEEKRQREAERQQRAEEERRRLEAWNERERARSSKTRDINDAKARHWQSWGGGGAEGGGADASSDPMAGTWLYGKKPNEYHIVQRSDGSLCFDGPSPSGAGRLRGALRPVDEWQEAEITLGNGEPFGTMRFIFVSGEDGEEGLISQCRKAGSSEWGREVFARRAARRGSPCEPSPTSAGSAAADPDATPASPSAAEAGGFQASGGAPPCDGEELRITVTVDQALGFSTELSVPRGTTVLQLKQRLAADDPTGSTAVSGFGLALPGEEALPDGTVLAERHCLLDICQLGEETRAASGAGAAEEVEAKSAEAAAEPRAAQEAAEPVSDLLAWLKGIRLEAYHEAIVENGFETLDDLREVPTARVEELAGLAGMKLGHAVRFRKAAKDLAGPAG